MHKDLNKIVLIYVVTILIGITMLTHSMNTIAEILHRC